VDLCLESVDVLKKTLHRQWSDEVEMRTGVDSLLGRVAEFAPLDPRGGSLVRVDRCRPNAPEKEVEAASHPQPLSRRPRNKQQAYFDCKSVRIALARLDRMMNTVGELVINRTRMVGRVAELEKLVTR